MVSTERILTSPLLTGEFRIVHVDISDHRGLENIGKLDRRNVLLAVHHAWRLAVVLMRERPSIVYVPLAQNILGLGRDLLLVSLGLIGRARVIAHVHGGGLGPFLEDAPWWFRATARALLRRAAALIVMSDSQRQQVASAIGAERLAVIPHGTESVEIPAREPRGGPLRAVYVSSYLAEEKGLDTVLKAASKAQQAGITDRWDIVGAWSNEGVRHRSEAMIDGIPGIRFHGALSREEILDPYASADVFVFPTLAPEGFPLVRIEAMAAGLPIITTEVGGGRESVRDGVDGFIVEFDSPDDIVNRLDELRSQPERRVEMGRRAQERQRALFSHSLFEGALANLWSEVAARQPASSFRASP